MNKRAVALRPLEPADLIAVAPIHAACFPEEPWSETALARLLTTAGCQGLLATATDGRTQGFLLWRLAADEAEIVTLAVAPDARRRGLAGALLDRAVVLAAAAGAAALYLEVAADNLAAQALYRRRGFRQVGRRPDYYRSGGDAMLLQLGLADTREAKTR